MKKLHHIICALLAVVVSAAMAACSDDYKYEWADKVADDSPAAYFAASNKASEILTPDEYANHQSVRLAVRRLNTKGAVDVPIVVDRADKEFAIPDKASFADGQEETTVEVGCQNLERLKTYSFAIHLDEKGTNPYLETDGSPVFNYNVLVAEWVKVVDKASLVWGKSEYASTKSDIYWLEGQNRFRIENFLGSGIDLQYYIVAEDKETGIYTTDAFNPADRTTWHGAFMPYDHFLNDPGGGSFWYLMADAANGEYAAWTPEGGTLGIDYINFYSDATSDSYSFIDMQGSSSSYASFLIPYVYYSDGSESGYTYLYMYWDSTNIPTE